MHVLQQTTKAFRMCMQITKLTLSTKITRYKYKYKIQIFTIYVCMYVCIWITVFQPSVQLLLQNEIEKFVLRMRIKPFPPNDRNICSFHSVCYCYLKLFVYMHKYCDLCLENNSCSLIIFRSAFALVINIYLHSDLYRVCMKVYSLYIIVHFKNWTLCFLCWYSHSWACC